MTHSDPLTEARPARERRRAERVSPVPLRVRLHRKCEGILINLSELGALVQLPSAPSPDKPITLHLEWQDITFQIRARVVRSIRRRLELPTAMLARTEYQVGLEFGDLSQDAAAIVRQIIQGI